MKLRKTVKIVGVATLCLGIALAATVGYRALRLYGISRDMRSQIRYLLETDGSIGTTTASTALSDSYLEDVLGDNPELLSQLKAVVSRGLAESPMLNLGEVSAMNVIYRKDKDDKIYNVVAHVFGGFPQGEQKHGFHRDGFFRNLTDDNLYTLGNKLVHFFGRDMIFFTEEENVKPHQELLEATLSGNIMPLVTNLANTIYYSTVFPNPENVVPPQLRKHVQAIVIKGSLGTYEGSYNVILMTASPRAARYTMSVLGDLKRTSEVILSTALEGRIKQGEWGDEYQWWAKEFLETGQEAEIEKDGNLIRIKGEYGLIMVNAVLKSIERMGRDLSARRYFQDPMGRDSLMGMKPGQEKVWTYWSPEHRDGPFWPIRPSYLDETNETETVESEDGAVPVGDAPPPPQGEAGEQSSAVGPGVETVDNSG